jgi:hypothetical protein
VAQHVLLAECEMARKSTTLLVQAPDYRPVPLRRSFLLVVVIFLVALIALLEIACRMLPPDATADLPAQVTQRLGSPPSPTFRYLRPRGNATATDTIQSPKSTKLRSKTRSTTQTNTPATSFRATISSSLSLDSTESTASTTNTKSSENTKTKLSQATTSNLSKHSTTKSPKHTTTSSSHHAKTTSSKHTTTKRDTKTFVLIPISSRPQIWVPWSLFATGG